MALKLLFLIFIIIISFNMITILDKNNILALQEKG